MSESDFDLTHAPVWGHNGAVAGIPATGIDSPETESRRKPAFPSMAFFVSGAHFTLWWIGRGGASLLGSLVSSLPTLHGLPPVNGSSVGRYISTTGANIMANQQAKSAVKTINEQFSDLLGQV